MEFHVRKSNRPGVMLQQLFTVVDVFRDWSFQLFLLSNYHLAQHDANPRKHLEFPGSSILTVTINNKVQSFSVMNLTPVRGLQGYSFTQILRSGTGACRTGGRACRWRGDHGCVNRYHADIIDRRDGQMNAGKTKGVSQRLSIDCHLLVFRWFLCVVDQSHLLQRDVDCVGVCSASHSLLLTVLLSIESLTATGVARSV